MEGRKEFLRWWLVKWEKELTSVEFFSASTSQCHYNIVITLGDEWSFWGQENSWIHRSSKASTSHLNQPKYNAFATLQGRSILVRYYTELDPHWMLHILGLVPSIVNMYLETDLSVNKILCVHAHACVLVISHVVSSRRHLYFLLHMPYDNYWLQYSIRLLSDIVDFHRFTLAFVFCGILRKWKSPRKSLWSEKWWEMVRRMVPRREFDFDVTSL